MLYNNISSSPKNRCILDVFQWYLKSLNNLITYFNNSHSHTNITIADHQNVLLALSQETLSNKQTTVNSPCFRLADYVGAFWIDDNDKY